MDLRAYLDELPRGDVSAFADQCGISSVYLLQLAARQDGRKPSPALAVHIEVATKGQVTRRDLRPDDWQSIWPELAANDGASDTGLRRRASDRAVSANAVKAKA